MKLKPRHNSSGNLIGHIYSDNNLVERNATMVEVNQNGMPGEELLAGLRIALDGEVHLLQGKGGLFPAGKKGVPLVTYAQQHELVSEAEPPAGVKATKTKKFVRLTPGGQNFLREQDDPKKVLEALVPVVEQLHDKVQRMGEELQTVLTQQLGQLGDVLQQTHELLSGVLQTAPREEASELSPPQPASPSSPTPALKDIIKQTYERMRGYVEYEAGDVVIPHLYHEVRQTVPDLSVTDFHDELLRLREQQKIELMELNEVREAQEPDKAIRRDDRLYYWLMWK